ncbi:MAG: hypothetical protein JNM56_31160, partial [Planctomycetia bacterium]|nr:hypothetical protein [Planctomycetia bacterium]
MMDWYASLRKLVHRCVPAGSRPRKRQRRGRARPVACAPSLEQLEDRLVPANLLLSLSGSTLTVGSTSDDDLYLTVSGGLLQWSTTGETGTFSSDLDSDTAGDQTLSVNSGTSIRIESKNDTDDLGTLFFQDFVTSGAAFTIDLTEAGDKVTLGNLATGGADFTVNTSGTIIVSDGAVVSTRAISGVNHDSSASIGDSGDLTLSARIIEVNTGAQVYAHVVGSGFAAGAITLTASDSLDDFTSGIILVSPFDPTNTSASVTLTGATIKGGAVSISAEADSADLWGDDDSDTGEIAGEIGTEFFSSLSLIGGAAVSKATSEITVSGGSITAESLSLDAYAATDAEITTITVYLAVAYGKSTPTARINIQDGARLSTTGDLTVSAQADSELAVKATQALLGVSGVAEKYNVTLAIAEAAPEAAARVSSDASLSVGGNLNLSSEVNKNHNVTSSAAAYADGVVGTAIAVSIGEATAEALLDGDAAVTGDVNIAARIDTEKNDTATSATVGSSAFTKFLTSGSFNPLGATGNLISSLTGGQVKNQSSQSQTQQFGLGAAITVAAFTNTATARVGPGAAVSAGGDLSVIADVVEFPEASAISTLNTLEGTSSRNNGVSAAIAVNVVDSTAEASIGSAAVVSAGGDVRVEAANHVPYEIQWHKISSLSDITDKLNFNLGIQNGFFTTWAEALSTANKNALGGSVNVAVFTADTRATIGDDAQVTAGGDLSVVALGENDTVNFVGSPLFFFNGSGQNGVGGAVMVIVYENDTIAKIQAGAVVEADSVLVQADNDMQSIGLGVQGGSAGNFAFNGALGWMQIDNRTIAKVSEDATLNVGDGLIRLARRFDSLSSSDNTLFAAAPQFAPDEEYDTDEDDHPLTRLDPDADTITLAYDHGLTTGQAVRYSGDDGTVIDGLADGATYYAIVVDASTLKLATTKAEADAGLAIDLAQPSVANTLHGLYPGFDPTATGTVDLDTDTLDVGFAHDLVTGQPVSYSSGDGTALGGLTDGATYYVIVTGATTYQLAASESDAYAGTALDLTAIGTGTGHSLLPTAFNAVRVDDNLSSLDTNGNGKLDTGDAHITSSDSDYYYTDLSMLVVAEDDSRLYSGIGGVSIGKNTGVGISIAVDVIDRTTKALIGSEDYALQDGDYAPGVGVDSTGTVNVGYAHGFSDGDTVIYTSGGDLAIAGLLDRQVYHVANVMETSFTLARSAFEHTQSFAAATAVDAVQHTLDLGYAHGFHTGDRVQYQAGDGDTAIDGLTDGGIYYVIVVDAQTIALSAVEDKVYTIDPIAFVPYLTVDGGTDEILLGYEHGLTTGQAVRYSANGGNAVGGLVDGTTYYIIAVDEEAIQLAASSADAASGSALDLDPTAAYGINHTLLPGFDPASDLEAADDRNDGRIEVIDLGYEHGFATGAAIRYDAASHTALGDLTDDTRYYAVVIDATRIALAASEAEANAGRVRYFDASNTVADFLLDEDGLGGLDTIDLFTTHGYATGDRVVYSANGGTALGGLSDGVTYYVIALDDATSPLDDTSSMLKLAATLEDAEDGIAITLTATGDVPDLEDAPTGFHYLRGDTRLALNAATSTGDAHFFERDVRLDLDGTAATGTAHTIRLALDPDTTTRDAHGFGRTFTASTAVSGNTIDLGYTHGFTTGQAVLYTSGEGTGITGLNEGQTYYVVVVDATRLQLAESADEAASGSPDVVELDASDAAGDAHGIAAVVRAAPLVDSALDAIDFGAAHGLTTGDRVTYSSGGDTAIGGLTDGATYYIIRLDNTTVQLAASADDAANGVALGLDATGTLGTGHTLSDYSLSATAGSVTADGAALVTATNAGEIVSVTLAAAVASPSATSWVKASGVSKNTASGSLATSGLTVSGDVAVNVVVSSAQAYLRDAHFVGTDLSVRAANETTIIAAAGAIAYASTTQDAKGLAGSVAINVIHTPAVAWIADSTVELTGDLDIASETDSVIGSFAISGSKVKGTLALAGSITVNVVSALAAARVLGGTTITAANVNLDAAETNEIYCLAGSVAIADGSFGSFSGGSYTSSSQTGVGFAAAVNVIDNGAGTEALIEDSDVDASGLVTLAALASNTIVSAAAAFALTSEARALAVAASLCINVVSTTTYAGIRRKRTTGVVANDGVEVEAEDSSTVLTLSGAGGFALNTSGMNSGVGAAIAVNVVNNNVTAEIDDVPLTTSAGSVAVTATSATFIGSVAIGGAAANSLGVAGSFSVNVIDNSIHAAIAGSDTVIDADGNVAVQADDHNTLFTLAGSVSLVGVLGYSGSGANTAIGVANSTVSLSNDVKAWLGDGVSVQADGNRGTVDVFTGTVDGAGDKATEAVRGVAVAAVSFDEITTISAGGAAGGRFAVAGSANVTVLNEVTHAWIGQQALINQATTGEATTQSVTVRAGERTDLLGIAGAIAYAGAGGFGAGIDIAVITKDTQAWIDSAAAVEAQNNVYVTAHSREDLISVAASIGISSGSGAPGASTSYGVAGSVDISVYDITTKAYLAGSNGSLSGATVAAGGSVVVSAAAELEADVGTGSAAYGGTAGVGGAIGVPVVTKHTLAFIGAGATVDAYANRDGVSVYTGEFSTAYDDDTTEDGEVTAVNLDNDDFDELNDDSYLKDRNATPETQSGFQGVAVGAVSWDTVEVYSVGVGASQTTAVQVSLGVLVVDSDVEATIGAGAQVNQNATAGAGSEQCVLVAAGSDFFQRAITGGIAVSTGSQAATPSINVSYLTFDTKAEIAASADVAARRNVSVTASSEQDLITAAVSIAGSSSGFAGAGSAGAIDLNNTTYAYISENAIVAAGGNVLVAASDVTDMDIVGGAAGVSLSGGGVGVGLGLALIDKDTQAVIHSGASVNADGQYGTQSIRDGSGPSGFTAARGVLVTAFSAEEIFTAAVSGSFGNIGVAGTITWEQLDSDTRAEIEDGAVINEDRAGAHADQDVMAVAVNVLDVELILGTVAASSSGSLAGTVDVGFVGNDTTAAIGGTIYASDDVRAAALGVRDIDSTVVNAAVSAGGAISGAVTVWTVGGNDGGGYSVDGASDDATEDGSGESATDDASEQLDDSLAAGDPDAFESSGDSIRGDNSAAVATHAGGASAFFQSIGQAITGDTTTETRAYIAANAVVTAGGDATVSAVDDTEATLAAGNLAGSANGSAGFSIAIFNLDAVTEAYVGADATLDVGGALRVAAQAEETLSNYVLGGAGAVFGALAVQYGEIDDTSSQYAALGAGAMVVNADSLTVTAAHDRTLEMFQGSAAVGAVAVGASIAKTTAGGEVAAQVGDDVQLGTSTTALGSLTVQATATDEASAFAVAVASGVLAGTSAEARTTVTPAITASVGDDATGWFSGDVQVSAEADLNGAARGTGGALSVGASGGQVIGSTVVSPTLNAAIGEDTALTAGNIEVQATLDSLAYSQGYGVNASLLLGATGLELSADSGGEVTAFVDAGSTLTASGDVIVAADATTEAEARALGAAAGIAAVGGIAVDVSSDTTTEAFLGNGVNVSADGLTIAATGTDTLTADAENYSGSFVGSFGTESGDLFAVDVDLDASSSTSAGIANRTGGTQSIEVGALTIAAEHATIFDGKADNVAASLLLGFGGARVDAEVIQAEVTAQVGSNVVIAADSIVVTAENRTSSTRLDSESQAGGSVATACGATTDVTVQHDTRATIGSGASITQTSAAGAFTVTAHNDAALELAADVIALSGLGSGADGNARARLPQFDAIVSLGTNANLVGLGEITLAAYSEADVFADAFAQAGGTVADSEADAVASVVSTNTVTVGAGATITSDEDIQLLAGQSDVLKDLNDLAPETNDFDMKADSYAYSGAAGAFADADADASVTQTNTITVAAGSVITSVGDVYLLTEEGAPLVSGTSYSYDYSAANGGSSSNSATNTVTVDGTIEVGIHNQQLITIALDGTVTATNGEEADLDLLAKVSGPTNGTLDGSFAARINQLIALKQMYAGTAEEDVYLAQIEAWVQTINDLGGEASYDSATDAVSFQTSITTSFYTIDDIYAASANIVVEADALFGGGDLIARGNTKIEVLNYTDASLKINDLEIPDEAGGEVLFNDTSITAASTVADLNETGIAGTVAFTVTAAGNSAEPEITVRNFDDVSHTRVAHLLLQGNVSNPDGTVAIDSAEGSVLTTGSLTAGTLVIESGGDFILSDSDEDGDGFFHVGGDPADLYDDVAGDNEDAESQVADVGSTPRSGTGGTIVAGNVFIAAEYLNVNGTIQSGIPEHFINIADVDGQLAATIAGFNTAYAANNALRYQTLAEKYITYTSDRSADDTVFLVWDAREQRLKLSADIEVKGGNIQLVGHILNTGGGQLKVMDGYGAISVDNSTGYTLVLDNLSAGEGADDNHGIEGRIYILDRGRFINDGTVRYYQTEITRLGNVVTKTTYVTNDAGGQTILSTTTANTAIGAVDPDAVHMTYLPDNHSYAWQTARKEYRDEVYERNNQNSQRTIAEVFQPQYLTASNPERTAILTTGRYADVDTPLGSDVYSYDFSEYGLGGVLNLTTYIHTTYDIFGHVSDRDYDHTLEAVYGVLDSHTHRLNANQAINITFMGNDGSIAVQSTSSVVLAGTLAARGGTVSITTDGSITSDSPDGVIEAATISLSAGTGIGGDGTLYTDLTGVDEGTLAATTTSGDIAITEASGDLGVLEVSAAGNVALTATTGGILGSTAIDTGAHVTGQSLTLTAGAAVGSENQELRLDSGSDDADTVTVTA